MTCSFGKMVTVDVCRSFPRFFFSAYLTVICVELYLLVTLLFHNELYMLTAYMLIAKENVFIRTLLNSLE